MQSRFRFRFLARLASRPRRWVVLALALAIGVVIGVVVADLLKPVESPFVELALPLRPMPKPQANVTPEGPSASTSVVPPSPAAQQPASPAARDMPVSPAETSPRVPTARTAEAPPESTTPPRVAALPPGPAVQRPAVPPMQPSEIAPSESRPVSDLPAWRRYAVAVPHVADHAMIAIVIDDMGVDQKRSAAVANLPAPLTLSFLPYARDLTRQTAAARHNGHELMVHVPMQPKGAGNNPGPNVLTTDLAPDEIKRRLDLALSAFDAYVGINNHMGSRFTLDRAGMDVVMAELEARGLLFLDSRTVPHSLGASTATAHDVPHAARHVFLDNELTAAEVNRQLAETERIARQTGFAIAIGHPHDVTIATLKGWLPTLQEKGFVLVPVSAIVARLEARRNATQTATPARQ